MVVSTIAIAEYCVKGDIHELPLRNLQILPFNIDHAKRAGEFARIVFDHKGSILLPQRTVIPNDSKLFAQADCEIGIEMYLSSDSESKKVFDIIKGHTTPRFQFIDLQNPSSETFGILDLK